MLSLIEWLGWANRVVRHEGVQGPRVGVIPGRPGLARVHWYRHPLIHVISPPQAPPYECPMKSSLCLPRWFSTEIPGDVLFPQDGPPKITQLSTQIEKIHRFAEEDSCSINKKEKKVKVIKHGLRFDGFRRLFASCSPFTVGEEGAGPFFQG